MSYQRVMIDKSIFRAYDIRGFVESQLSENAMYTLGLAVGKTLQLLSRQQVFLARDGRLTSEALATALAAGLVETGLEVLDLGATTTPVMYYATHVGGVDSGLIVTGSHNPADYNGLKMVLAGRTLVNEDIERLYQHVVALQTAEPATVIEPGRVTPYSIEPSYIERIVKGIHLQRPMKVVVDCGNGIPGLIVPKVLTALGCDVIELYCDVDGRFPNHHPDPTVEANMQDLRDLVLETGADIGFGFDGDGDRLGVVTNHGDMIWPDRLMMFYVQDILNRHPGATIVFDVKCSKALKQQIEEAGGTALMCPTGHSIVKGVMKETQAPLAGEMSGHLFFKDRWYGFDDALYSGCRLLELLSAQSLSASEQFSLIPHLVSTPEIKIPIAEAEKFEFIRRFSEESQFEDASLITIDGLRVEFSNGWGLLRASNTTPCLVARFEADDIDALELIQALFKVALLKIESGLELPF
ncbi:MAG: phosphomannomutase/phosphoglucomutase [Gammaproteobacteria bacterium]|nr:phosphomannomutase/phosphoglucomutase [Gammaproteobacteria bacterium]